MVATRRGKTNSDGAGANTKFNDTDITLIPKLHHKQVEYFESHATKPLEWRQAQLKALYNLLQDNRDEWADALNVDLGKHKIEVGHSDPPPRARP